MVPKKIDYIKISLVVIGIIALFLPWLTISASVINKDTDEGIHVSMTYSPP
ncbi:conserved hypothetical protein [Methanocaldococcus sp. FS406-22]|uniref:hypothetical protein n=1 Tax=Methanocaldococcus sp. (strain FS406-22) TaxID=644281 RepID=UPI0001BF3EC8|nr:hypothetical protein [Methanocaldococcus sp. FS406-22]ADC69709.1 conserved hypothetical protein [Methanocaldococcus sp. FS406-22]